MDKRSLKALSNSWRVAASAWMSRGVTIVCQLLVIRLLIGSIGGAGYAAWALIAAMYSWGLMLDFGLGSSLQNLVAEKRGDEEASNYIIRYVFFIQLGSLALAIMGLFLFSGEIAAVLLKQFDGFSMNEKVSIVKWGTLAVLVSASGQTIQKIRYGRGEGLRANVVAVVAIVLGLLCVFLIPLNEKNKVSIALVAFFLPSGLVFWADYFFVLRFKRKSEANYALLRKRIMREGLNFLFLGVLAGIVLQTAPIFMSQFAAPDEIAAYSILMRVLGVVQFVYGALLQALAPEISACVTNEQRKFIFDRLKIYLTGGLVCLVFGGFVFLSADTFVLKIIAPAAGFKLGFSLTVVIFIYYMVRIWSDTFATFLTSLVGLVN
jgi:O-antigen/teichoic acid export membrane protein